MTRTLLLVTAAVSLTIAPVLAASKAPAKPKPGQLTTTDLRTCMGLNNAKPEDQIPACTKIIKSGDVKRPYEGDYYATRGAAYFALGQLNEALSDLNKAISIRQAPEFYFQRGLIQVGRTEVDAAKSDFDQTIKLKPKFGPSYMMRGLIAYRAGDFADAQSFFDKAVKAQPNYFQAIYARGAAKKRNGDEAGGAKDIAAARSISGRADEDAKKLGLTS